MFKTQVQSTLQLGTAILTPEGLGFLGLGVQAANLLGDGLRDALDPRMKLG